MESILIQPPNFDSIYYNYKHFFSLVLMNLYDLNYCFVWIDIGSFSKDSNSRIYKESSLYKNLSEKKLYIPDPRPITNNGDIRVPYVIVADEAFGMSKNLMKSYGGKMLSHKKKVLFQLSFNFGMSLCRMHIWYNVQ